MVKIDVGEIGGRRSPPAIKVQILAVGLLAPFTHRRRDLFFKVYPPLAEFTSHRNQPPEFVWLFLVAVLPT